MNPAEPSDQPAPEIINVESCHETYYPDIKSTVKVFFVFIFYSIVIGIPFGIFAFILATAHLNMHLVRSY